MEKIKYLARDFWEFYRQEWLPLLLLSACLFGVLMAWGVS